MNIGTEVIRVKGDNRQIGMLGTVVEVQGERLRVFWQGRGTTKAKRTWVNQSVVKIVPPEGPCQSK